MSDTSTCIPDSERRSELFQRVRRLGLWDEVERFIAERRKIHRAAGMTRKDAGETAWAEADQEFPKPNRENLERLLELSNFPPVIASGARSEFFLWHWITAVELVVRVLSLMSQPEIEQRLITAIAQRVSIAPEREAHWASKLEVYREKTAEMLPEHARGAIAILMEKFSEAGSFLTETAYDEAIRNELQVLTSFCVAVVELQTESTDSLRRALHSPPQQSTLSSRVRA